MGDVGKPLSESELMVIKFISRDHCEGVALPGWGMDVIVSIPGGANHIYRRSWWVGFMR